MSEIGKSTDFFKVVDSFREYKEVRSVLIYGDEKFIYNCEVSVVIPTFKRSKLVKEAIDSAINQIGFEDYCILVIDNDPTRGCETERLLSSYQNPNILYFKNEKNIGMFGNQNRCFELAMSEWVVLLHDDDLLLPTFLVDCMSIIHQNSKIDGLQPKRFIWKDLDDKLVLPPCFHDDYRLRRIYDISNCVAFQAGTPSGGLFRREKIILLGGYNPQFHPTSDFCFSVNFARECGLFLFNKTLSVYRILDNESINVDTLSKFVIHDFFLKNQLMKRYKIGSYIRYKLLSYIVDLQVSSLMENFNTEFEFERLKLPLVQCNLLEYYLLRGWVHIYSSFLIIPMLKIKKYSQWWA